jgi:ABC-type sugar transport system permease subunit
MAHKRKNWLPLILTSPAILAIIGTMVPFVTAFYYSFTNYSIVKPEHKFVWLANYVKLFTDAEFQEVLEQLPVRRHLTIVMVPGTDRPAPKPGRCAA